MNFNITKSLVMLFIRISAGLMFFTISTVIFAQSPSRITEEGREILTYPFDDPSPVVTVSSKTTKIFPYTTFDGYSKENKKKKWKVVKLENDYVEVYVMPEIGGKIGELSRNRPARNYLSQ